MSYPVLSSASATVEQFIEFWDRTYSGYDEAFYQQHIGQPLTPERIAGWFEWKNGTPLSPGKAKSIRRYAEADERLVTDADDAAVRVFLNRPGGAIWRIFWLHLQHPNRFPIYDQHVHRAMAFLLGWDDLEIPVHNPSKVRVYLDEYLPSLDSFGGQDRRRLDRALWAFGKFVGSHPNMLSHTTRSTRAETSTNRAGR